MKHLRHGAQNRRNALVAEGLERNGWKHQSIIRNLPCLPFFLFPLRVFMCLGHPVLCRSIRARHDTSALGETRPFFLDCIGRLLSVDMQLGREVARHNTKRSTYEDGRWFCTYTTPGGGGGGGEGVVAHADPFWGPA